MTNETMTKAPDPLFKGRHYCKECGEDVYWDGVDEWLHNEPVDDHAPEPEQRTSEDTPGYGEEDDDE